MYEAIDEIDLPEDGSDDKELSRRRLWVSGVVVLGLAVLFAVALFSEKAPITPEVDLDAIKAEQAAYHAALTDVSPALRRARLKDFINAYPESARLLAVKAQMSVLDAREADDWAALTNIIYDTERSKEDKEAALELYESHWNSALLGGRDKDLKRMRERAAAQNDNVIDQGLLIDPESYPDPIPSDEMLGGSTSRSDVFFRPQGRGADDGTDNPYRANIEPPRVRRNVKPRYPRRARRRGVEAQIVLRLYIDDRGRVEMTELVSAEANRYEDDFIEAAEYAALRMRFYPKTVNGNPVPSAEVEKRYRFQMKN